MVLFNQVVLTLLVGAIYAQEMMDDDQFEGAASEMDLAVAESAGGGATAGAAGAAGAGFKKGTKNR